MKTVKKSIKNFLLYITFKYVKKKEILNCLLNREEKEAIKQTKRGYFYNIGWWQSFKNNNPVDLDNNPLPWVTYSFISFIEGRLTKAMTLFEYGSGNSTLYYASKVKEVYTIEHDQNWYNDLKGKMPENVIIKYKELEYGGDYCKAASTLNMQFDIIIVDGRDRVNCLISSIDYLSNTGVFVLDDSEREAYQLANDKLIVGGFKRLDFWGISPGLNYKKCTSIYYRNNNILNI